MKAVARLPRILSFPVEAGHIQLFARAIGDPNPIYHDADYAVRTDLGGIVAPPTFSEAGNHFDLDWPYRPQWDRHSTAQMDSTGAESAPSGTAMHAETHFVYHHPARPGMILSGNARAGDTWEKHGQRSGALHFHEVITEFVDQHGTPIVDCRTVVLRTEHVVALGKSPSDDDETPAARQYFPVDDPSGRSPLVVGSTYRDVLIRNLSRAQIVQYAGAAGDFSLQHVDEFYNTRTAGYPSVFAHGMLTMGMAGRALTDFAGDGRLKTFGFQFRQQVWPGDSLFVELEVIGVDLRSQPTADIRIKVTNQTKQIVGTGYANAVIQI